MVDAVIAPSTSWRSYPSIYALGHRAIADLLTVPVNVEEKIDGSQFSFGVFPELPNEGGYGGLRARSKGAQLHIGAPERMFQQAIDVVKTLAPKLIPGWTYRAEYLAKPKHNALAYDRIPRQHLILFDVNSEREEEYLTYESKAQVAADLGLDVVPLLFTGRLEDASTLRGLFATTSILGGQKIEGVVIKPSETPLFGADKKLLMGKFVSEAFKEVRAKSWSENNSTRADVLEKIKARYRAPGRWAKAVQHLTEAGVLEGSPRDIRALMREVPADVLKECENEIKEDLFKWAWPQIARASCAGLPQWYKEELVKRQFEKEAS